MAADAGPGDVELFAVMRAGSRTNASRVAV